MELLYGKESRNEYHRITLQDLNREVFYNSYSISLVKWQTLMKVVIFLVFEKECNNHCSDEPTAVKKIKKGGAILCPKNY